MDERLKVTDTPREGVADGLADIPLISLVWRWLHEEHRNQAEESSRLQKALLAVAEETILLRRTLTNAFQDPDGPLGASQLGQLQSTHDRLEEALARLGVTILSPEGEPFTSELMDLFENVAQLAAPEAREPRVAEVLSPAITYRSTVLQMGKVVIAVPPAPDGEA